MLQVRLLGQFDVRLDGRRVLIPSRAGQSLLAYLATTAGVAHRREKLAGMLWPDIPDESARRNLRQELWRIRKALAVPQLEVSDFVLADELTVAFNGAAECWLDAAQLQRVLPADASPDERIQQVALYEGPLLPGFYDEWIILERERLQVTFEARMQELIERLIAEGRWNAVLDWSERWISLAPAPEPAYRAEMLAYAALGDQSRLATTYERCMDNLDAALGVLPSEETRVLYDQLIRGEPHAELHLAARRAAAPQRAATHDEPPAAGEPPFRGLQYFDEADADLFFGREALSARLVARLREADLLAVVIGASGSGKSSVVRAGMVPMLRRGEPHESAATSAQGVPEWQVHVITPAAHPLESLAVSLTRDSASLSAATTLTDDLSRDPRSLRLFARRMLESDSGPKRLLLVVDQFEELFTLCRDEFEREAFIDNLLGAITPETGGQVTLVITIRADFYSHLAQYPELREMVSRQQEYIGPMTADELRRAIEEPARRGGWDFETGLVDLILRDVGDEPGALPLLSHALLETWHRRSGRLLTLKGYNDSGGVRGAIAHTAETVYQSLTTEQQAIARDIFLRLTELGEGTEDTRRRASLQELITHPAEATETRAVLSRLADARLITTGEGTAEVAHEALIREWPTLREWLSQDREGLHLHRHITEAVHDWELLERDAGALYRGARLAQAREWAAANPQRLNSSERAFVEASIEQEQREALDREAQRQRELEAAQKLAESERRAAARLRRRAVLLAAALVLAVGLAGAAAFFGAQADRNARTAQQSADLAAANAREADSQRHVATQRELAASALANLSVDPERSILLLLEALSSEQAGGQRPSLEVIEALHRAVEASRVQLNLRGQDGEVTAVAYSSDGTRLATQGRNGTLKIWDSAGGKEVLSIRTGEREGLDDFSHTISFSVDGTRLAAPDAPGAAGVWDTSTGEQTLRLFPLASRATAAVFSPDGALIATGGVDGTAVIWDAATGQKLLTLPMGTEPVSSVAFSPDGKRLAAAAVAGSLYATGPQDSHIVARIWDLPQAFEPGSNTAPMPQTLAGPPSSIHGLSFSPDGRWLVTAGSDKAWRVWDVNSGENVRTIPAGYSDVNAIAFDRTGARLATAGEDGIAKIWDFASGQEILDLTGHSSGLLDIAFSPDGRHVATASRDLTARVWDVSPEGGAEWLNLAGPTDRVDGVAYSPDGKRIATIGWDGTIAVWDAQSGGELRRLRYESATCNDPSQFIYDVAFSPDGSQAAFGRKAYPCEILAWDLATGKPSLYPPSILSGGRVAYSPDGSLLALDRAILDARTGHLLVQLPPTSGRQNDLVFSHDGRLLVTTYDDGTAKLWDAASGELVLNLPGQGAVMNGVAFSPDDALLATTSNDAAVSIWDARTGSLLHKLTGARAPTFEVAFSPDGRYLAASSLDSTIRVWDTQAGWDALPLTLYGHTAAAYGIAFSPDGKRLAASSADGTTRIYVLDLQDLIAMARSRLTRTLTIEECRQFLHMETCPGSP